MSFTIHRHLDSATLQKRLPKRFQIHYRDRDFISGDFALIVFSDKHTVLSSHVRKALGEILDLTEPNRIAVGYAFTQESFELFTAQGFRWFFEYDSFFTDERLKAIR